MASRLYFSTDVPTISPTFDASWESTGNAVRRLLVDSKADVTSAQENLASGTTLNSPAGAVDSLNVQYVSAPLSGAQTISGQIKAQMRVNESNAAADARAQAVIWVRTSAGGVRGTLVASSGAALSSEFSTTTTNRKFPLGAPVTPTSVAAQDGDRIIVEFGWRKHENATTSRTATFVSGYVSTDTDLPEDESTTTANAPWIEFADTLVFQTTPIRESQASIEAVIEPDKALRESQASIEVVYETDQQKMRASQVSIEVVTPRSTQLRSYQEPTEVLVDPEPAARFSQVPVEVAIGPPLTRLRVSQAVVEALYPTTQESSGRRVQVLIIG